MHVTIDLARDDMSGWRGGRVEWSDPCTLEDVGAITLHLGPVDLSLSYGQFETMVDNIQRWRWSLPCEGSPVDLTANHPPPSWDAHVLGVATEMASERHTLADMLEREASTHGTVPGPPKDDKVSLRHFLDGWRAGRKEGLEHAAAMIRDRSAKHGPPGGPKPPAEPPRKAKRRAP